MVDYIGDSRRLDMRYHNSCIYDARTRAHIYVANHNANYILDGGCEILFPA